MANKEQCYCGESPSMQSGQLEDDDFHFERQVDEAEAGRLPRHLSATTKIKRGKPIVGSDRGGGGSSLKIISLACCAKRQFYF
jgi:hypothetical protein